ncbi:formin-like protein 16 [Canna indica]|uniref:Formin-like protein 16 n=1 Tax=Canna indica TaxID=4628 RepID=A0AAQ3KNL0_9LILI|nr:formin-like protein 16 [Canna indica]
MEEEENTRTAKISSTTILNGRRLSSDVLERITKIALTKEEDDLIRGYSGNPSKLDDGESFLFHILRAVPAAPFVCLDVMLFATAYEPEMAQFMQSLQMQSLQML